MDLENWVDFDNWAFSGIKYDIFSRLMVLADCYFAKFKVNEIGIGMKSMKHVFDNFFLNTLNTRALCTWELEYIFNNSKQTQNPFTPAALFYVLAVPIKRKSIVKFTLRVWLLKLTNRFMSWCHLLWTRYWKLTYQFGQCWQSSGQSARLHLWQPEFESHWSLQFYWQK